MVTYADDDDSQCQDIVRIRGKAGAERANTISNETIDDFLKLVCSACNF